MTEPSPDRPATNPSPLVVASSLVAIQGVALLGAAVIEAASVEEGRRSLGWSTAGFFAAYGVVLLAAAWGLARRRHWTRGPVLITQLIALGLAWNLREHVAVAIVLAVAALVVLAGMLHPDSIDALEGRARGDQSPDSSE